MPSYNAEVDAKAIINRMPMSPDDWLAAQLKFVADPFGVEGPDVIDGLVAFDRERLSRAPAASRYPESAPWVEYALDLDQSLKRLGLSEAQRAAWRSGSLYFAFRGPTLIKQAPTPERCRVAYVPETDVGAVHIKNVDDPLSNRKHDPEPPDPTPYLAPLVWDGTGSGLHLDDEPEELFPLPIHTMCMHNCTTVPEAVDFLTRYRLFWGGANCVLHDRERRSVAIEKCAFTQMQVHHPGPDGISYCSGMVCRDPDSAIARHMQSKRQQYLRLMRLENDPVSPLYWETCDAFERKLAEFLRTPAALDAQALTTFFVDPWPDGLCKKGARVHPDQTVSQYTLATRVIEIDRGRFLRWQCDADGRYPERPEVTSLTPAS